MGMTILVELLFSLKKDNTSEGSLAIRKYSLLQKKMNEWNTLSTYYVNASSVNMFKNNIVKYLRRVVYTQIKKVLDFR